jgi:hypothetical protein
MNANGICTKLDKPFAPEHSTFLKIRFWGSTKKHQKL